jgi:hypothetical protein
VSFEFSALSAVHTDLPVERSQAFRSHYVSFAVLDHPDERAYHLRVRRSWAARLVLAVVGLYELRSLVLSAAHALTRVGSLPLGSAAVWWLALCALALGAGLWQTGRGIGAVARPPGWGLRLVGTSLMLASTLLVILSTLGSLLGHGAVVQLLGSATGWAHAPAAVTLGIFLAASVDVVRWLAERSFVAADRSAPAIAAPPVQRRPPGCLGPTQAPLAARPCSSEV